jgi:hypothetical protein
MFSDSVGEFRADPDLLVELDETIVAVGDVKYKSLAGPVLSSDLYQLLSHAAAYETNSAFFVYPGSAFHKRRLGRAATGCVVTVFVVDIEAMEESLLSVLKCIAPAAIVTCDAMMDR